ncbi:MAG: HAMP domain-containing protein [Desulfobacterales bacterium]|nr:HAMP domain-containing protein [Desulfobacterales bacterium]
MIGIGKKLMLGFGGLLAVVVLLGVLTMSQIEALGSAIDVILRENYRSVVACQEMQDSLERVDSGLLFTLAGHEAQGRGLIEAHLPRFRTALHAELGNITLAGEQEQVDRIGLLFARYAAAIPAAIDGTRPLQARQADYFATLLPLFDQIKETARQVLLMNQMNMHEANDAARRLAATTHRRMLVAILVAALLTLLFGGLVHGWILRPLRRLIESTHEIRRGNLDLVLESNARDEIGHLSREFNAMAAALRQTRHQERLHLARSRRATGEVFKALPSAVAVLDLDGRVEMATETASRHFGLRPGVSANGPGFEWLPELRRKALEENRAAAPGPENELIQRFIENREHFFQPSVVPIPSGPGSAEPTGTALILKDVTQEIEQREMKRDVISTVSHQLKTPLTSLRMSIHLLLEERVGALNAQQTELLLAAREESERLVAFIGDWLDLDRIASGKARLSLRPADPRALVQEALEPVLAESRDKGVTLVNATSEDLPEVLADASKMRQVFLNVFSNALRFTPAGGTISVQAFAEERHVRFTVQDSGAGIPPEHLEHIFEPFYRGAEGDDPSGVGLGLAIVKQLVEAHGGGVNVESQAGRGTTLSFTLARAGKPVPADTET